MKRILLIITLFISITSAKTITIASDMWCPYNCSPKSKQPGYIIEVAKAVFEPLGYKVIYKLMPWSRALKMTEYGKINAVAGALKSDAPSFIYTKNSLGIGRIAFCKLNDNKWDYKDINSLNSEKLGIVKDYSYGDSIDNYINKQSDNTNKILTLTAENPFVSVFKLLESKRISIFADDISVLRYQLSQNSSKDNFSLVNHNDTYQIYIAFSPKLKESKEYAKILDDGIKRLRKNGQLQHILDKYGLMDWK